jgi:cold shock CspA family protein
MGTDAWTDPAWTDRAWTDRAWTDRAWTDRAWTDIEGVVESFDDAVGLGVVLTSDGRRVPFHCIGIADGTRTIAAGTAVRFDLRAGLGRFEATALRPR